MINDAWFFGIGGGIITGLTVVVIMTIKFKEKCAKKKLDKFKNDPVTQLAKSNPFFFFILMSSFPFIAISLFREEPILCENVIAPDPLGTCIINYTFPFVYALIITISYRYLLAKIDKNGANQRVHSIAGSARSE